MAQYAAHLIKENNTMKALELFVKHGAPPISQVGRSYLTCELAMCVVLGCFDEYQGLSHPLIRSNSASILEFQYLQTYCV